MLQGRPSVTAQYFTTTCTEQRRYVIFYNERVDRVTYLTGYELQNVYTELCEVIVQGISQIGTIILHVYISVGFFLLVRRVQIKYLQGK